MHIPDGFLDTKTWVATTIVTGGVLAVALRKSRERLDERQIPLVGMTAAFIFAAQMITFPIAGATSGHMLGGALAAALFGPWTAAVIMASVLIVQALFFQDGGITSLGANILNVGIITAFVGYGFYRLAELAPGRRTWRAVCVVLASLVSVVASSVAASIELAASGIVPLVVALRPMVFWHTLIGIGEGIITLFALEGLFRHRGMAVRPQHSESAEVVVAERASWKWSWRPVTAAIVLAGLLSGWAATTPDGLERVAEDLGFITQSTAYWLAAPFPDYGFRSGGFVRTAASVAGLVGVVLTFAVLTLVLRLRRSRR